MWYTYVILSLLHIPLEMDIHWETETNQKPSQGATQFHMMACSVDNIWAVFTSAEFPWQLSMNTKGIFYGPPSLFHEWKCASPSLSILSTVFWHIFIVFVRTFLHLLIISATKHLPRLHGRVKRMVLYWQFKFRKYNFQLGWDCL